MRNCALGPQNPKRDSDLALNPHRSVSSQAGSLLKTESGYFQRKREKRGKSGYRFQTEWKKPLIVVRLEVPAHRPTQRGISTHCLKKGGATPTKAVSHKLIHPVLHPYLNSSVHFAQFSADPDNIPNMTRSWINSSPRYVAERKRHFYRIEFFLSSKFGKWSHHCWEGWEGSCVSPKALPSKKQDTVPGR